MAAELSFVRDSRSPASIAGVTVYLVVVFGLWWAFDAAGWVILLLLLPALPALYELGRNPRAGLTLNAASLGWFSGERAAQVSVAEIDRVRMDTRWDFSVRVTLLLLDGKKVQLPHESLPPHREFEQALEQSGIRVERHHFTVF